MLANSNDFGGERGGKLHVDSPGYVTEMARRLRQVPFLVQWSPFILTKILTVKRDLSN